MQQAATAPAAPPAPVTLTPPAPPVGLDAVAGVSQAPAAAGDLSQFSVSTLRRMLSELRQQRAELASRRDGIDDEYENATGANREGIGERIRVLDNNIVRYEVEIERVGREIVARGGGTTEASSPGGIPSNYMSEDDAAAMAFAFSFTTLLLAVFFTRRFMLRRFGKMPSARHQPNVIASNERLDRIEQAVDTIAVEIERVSENQRFMTRLMTETQLGETIKDVKKSAELARAASADSPD